MNDLTREISGSDLAKVTHIVDEHLVRDLANAAARQAQTTINRDSGMSWRQAKREAASAKATPDMLRIVRAQLGRGAPLQAARQAAIPFYSA